MSRQTAAKVWRQTIINQLERIKAMPKGKGYKGRKPPKK